MQENKGFISRTTQERQLMLKEIKRRFWSFFEKTKTPNTTIISNSNINIPETKSNFSIVETGNKNSTNN